MDIDQIVEKIRKDMPKDLNEIEIAKYIYIQLGKIKSYDEKYYFGNNEIANEKMKQYINNL